MSTFMNTPAVQPSPDEHAFAATLRDDMLVQNFCSGDPKQLVTQLNRDLGTQFSEQVCLHVQSYFRNTARRTPTVGELRLLDALDRQGNQSPDRIAVGELITSIHVLAETWADMMYKHGELYGVGSARIGKEAVAAPPCSLIDALSLTGHYLYRTQSTTSHRALTSAPWQEAIAVAKGYEPITRYAMGKQNYTLWTCKHAPSEGIPARTGDFILYLPQAEAGKMRALLVTDGEKAHPALGDIRAIAQKPLLLTLLELCSAADLYIHRLYPQYAENGCIPVEKLCASPVVEDSGICDYLLRVPLKQVRHMNDTLKALGITAVVCGQVRANGQTVIHIRDRAGKRDVPVADLASSLLVSMAPVYLHAMTADVCASPDQPIPPPVGIHPTRLPSAIHGEEGLTPDGREVVALTLHEGLVLHIPEAQMLVSCVEATVTDRHTAFTAGAEAVVTVTDHLFDLSVAPRNMILSVTLTVSSAEELTDGTALAAICGLYRAAAERGLPIEDPIINQEPLEGLLRMTVTAHAEDRDACVHWETVHDHQWHFSGKPVHKEAPCFLFPVLRRSWESSLKALSAALNRDDPAACCILPIVMDIEEVEIPADTSDEASQESVTPHKETRQTLNPDSVAQLAQKLLEWNTPVFAMSESDTRLLLSEPMILDALARIMDMGYPLIILGESCKPFAEQGFLPSALTAVDSLPAKGTAATVTYAFPADAVTRLLRADPLAPVGPSGSADRHLLTLRLPNGQSIPDGFVGRGGKVLGLLNGFDTTVLPLLRKHSFEF